MTTPDELERAASNLKGLARDLERFDPWSGTRSKSDATDLRAILSERAELLAAVERMREALDGINELARDRLALIPPDLVHGGVLGELLLEILTRAALTTGEATGSPIGQNDQPGLAFSDAGKP